MIYTLKSAVTVRATRPGSDNDTYMLETKVIEGGLDPEGQMQSGDDVVMVRAEVAHVDGIEHILGTFIEDYYAIRMAFTENADLSMDEVHKKATAYYMATGNRSLPVIAINRKHILTEQSSS